MTDVTTAPKKRPPIVFTRVDPPFRDEVVRVANRDFDGNVSRLVRDSVRLMVDLRDELGPRFDLVIHGLLSNGSGDRKP